MSQTAKYAARNTARTRLRCSTRAVTTLCSRTIGTVVGSIMAPTITSQAPVNSPSTSTGSCPAASAPSTPWWFARPGAMTASPASNSQHTPAPAQSAIPGS